MRMLGDDLPIFNASFTRQKLIKPRSFRLNIVLFVVLMRYKNNFTCLYNYQS